MRGRTNRTRSGTRRRRIHCHQVSGKNWTTAASATVLAGVACFFAVGAGGTSQGISVPAGFRVETFARGLSQPTAMAYGPDGRIYVTQTGGSLAAVRRGTRRPAVPARAPRAPLGLAGHGRELFVSEQGRLERFTLRGGRLVGRRVIVQGLPFGEHQQDNVVVALGRGRRARAGG